LQRSPSDREIGKAEHLKALLIDWMLRHNGGSMKYYTNSKWNKGKGSGDVAEVRKRRSWKELSYWQSDSMLRFAKPVERQNGEYVQNEYLYIGRSTPGVLSIDSISVQGAHARYFSVNIKSANIRENAHIRVKVSFRSPKRVSINALNAHIEIRNSENAISRVEFGIDDESRDTEVFEETPATDAPSV
jgi:hypothetical protein